MNRRDFIKSVIIGGAAVSIPLHARASKLYAGADWDISLYPNKNNGSVYSFNIPIEVTDGDLLVFSFSVEGSDGTAVVGGKTYYGTLVKEPLSN